MAKLRSDYSRSLIGRLDRWVSRGSNRLEERMVDSLSDSAEACRGGEAPDVEHALRGTRDRRQEVLQREAALYDRRRAWSHTRGAKIARALYLLLAIALCAAICAVLLTTVSNLPSFGGENNPINNEVSRRYIERGVQETGAVNIVSGMILDYRAFDTLGESNVLFIAVCAVMIFLRRGSGSRESAQLRECADAEGADSAYEPKNDIILQRVAAILVPIVLLFGLYVILNGHLGPGGGFSGGAVMGAGLILYLNAYGFAKTERFFTARTYKVISCSALAFYALAKAYSFFCGANHVDSGIGLGIPGRIFSAGLILYLNIAVGMVVCCTMYAFYALFRKGDF